MAYFPHLTSTGPAPTANEIYTTYRRDFQKQVFDGIRRPIVFPFDFLGIFILVVYLCIPHKQNRGIYAARWPLVFLITWIECQRIQKTLGTGPDLGFSCGMISAYIVMLTWTWLIFKRPQWDAKRVEKRRVRVTKDMKKSTLDEELRQKEKANGLSVLSTEIHHKLETENEETYEYFWQSYPENLKDRISWVVDLIFNARGPGWNWTIKSIPSLTPETLSRMDGLIPGESYPYISRAESKDFRTRYKYLLSQSYEFILYYLAVDVLMTIMLKDPYFKFGPTTYDLPPYLQSLHPFALQFFRLLISALVIMASFPLSSIFINIFMSHVLGPKVLGLRGEPCYYPKALGKFSHVFDRGLNGLWGGFWHQTFRVSFSAPTKYLMEKGFLKPGRFSTKLIGLLIAFSISGFLHWAPMATAFVDTFPFDQVTFFVLQGVGIALQDLMCKLLSSFIIKLPKSIRRTGNLIYTLTWLYLTGWIASDNFSRAGLWLVSPLPFSLMRTLGFAEHDASFGLLKYSKVIWYTNTKWWESGITII